jgi:hypothetical protein
MGQGRSKLLAYLPGRSEDENVGHGYGYLPGWGVPDAKGVADLGRLARYG